MVDPYTTPMDWRVDIFQDGALISTGMRFDDCDHTLKEIFDLTNHLRCRVLENCAAVAGLHIPGIRFRFTLAAER